MDDSEYRSSNPRSIFAPQDKDSKKRRDWDEFQHMLVTRVMLYFRLARARNNMIKQNGGLSFFGFEDLVGDFPLFLDCHNLGRPVEKPIHQRQDSIFPIWLKSPHRLPFLPLYMGFYDFYRGEPLRKGRTMGLIFPRKGFRYGLVVHDGDPAKWVPEGDGYVVFAAKKRRPRLVVQSFQGMLDCLAKIWKPSRRLYGIQADDE